MNKIMTKEELISEIIEIIDNNMSYVLSACLNDRELEQLEYDIDSSLDDIKSDIRELINEIQLKQD